MAEDVDDSFGFTVPIPIPTIPASFFPDVPPISPLAGSGATTKKKIVAAIQSASIDTTIIATTTVAATATATPTPTKTSGYRHRQHHKHDRKGHHDCRHHKSKKQQKDKKSKD